MVKFLGDGSAWINGIPARDLSIEEWAELTDEQKLRAVVSGLYESAVVVESINRAVLIDSAVDVVEPVEPSQPTTETQEAE